MDSTSRTRYKTFPLYLDFPENKIDIFTPCDVNYAIVCGGHTSYMAEWTALKKVDIWKDFQTGWIISFCRRYVIIDKGKIIYQNPIFFEEYTSAMEFSYPYDSYHVFFDSPYIHTYIDMFGNECTTSIHKKYYNDKSLEEILQESILFSINNKCQVVIMKTMECHDRH